jgi:hypothetical protein
MSLYSASPGESIDYPSVILQQLFAAAGPAASTSSVLVCALLQPLMVNLGKSLQQRQQLVKGL